MSFKIEIDGTVISGSYATPIFSGVNNNISGYTIEFDKYFPYDNGNGEPIYDEDTGDQLRDPITGL